MAFDLNSAMAVREREDGLLEKDTFDLSTAAPVPDGVKPDIVQEVFSDPMLSKMIDTVTGGITEEQSSKFMQDVISPLSKIADIIKDQGKTMSIPEAGNKLIMETGKFILSAIGRPVSAVQSGLSAAIDKKPAGEILQSIFKGYLQPEEVKSLVSKVPFQEWEQGGWERLIPRATAEAVESYVLSTVVYGNVAGKIKNAFKSGKEQAALRELDNITTKMSKEIAKDPAKFKLPKDMGELEIKAYLQNRLGTVPEVGDVLIQRQSILSKLKAKLTSESGQFSGPKVGDSIDWKGEIGKITKIDGERVMIALGKSEIVATLSQLSLPKVAEVKQPAGEGQKPPVEPPKTAISGEPENQYNKLFKDYVRATPVGKAISKSANIKQELANEDFLIKSYESDISKLEEQIKVEQFNTEAEKIKAQDKLIALKDKYALAKETQRQKKAYRDEVAGLVKSITTDPKENIAIEYQDMIEQLQSKFDLKRRTESTETKREGMKAFVERMKVEGKTIDIPAGKLAMLDKLTLNEMTLDQLKEVKTTIDKLSQLGKTKLKAREAVYTAAKEKAKTELIKTATPIKSKELSKLPVGEKHNAWSKKAIEIQNSIQKTGVGLTPIDGLADVTGMGKMKEVLDKDFSKYLSHNDKAIDDWYKLTKDFTEKEFERIGVVAASRQEGGLERLANSGITEAEVKAIQLTSAEEKAYKFVLETFDKEYPAVKQYSKEVYNTDVGQQENYVSFMSDYEQMSDLEIYQRFGQTPEQVTNRKTKTVERGFTKERAGLSKIKLETNIDKIFRRHMDDVAYMLNTGKNIKMYFEIINSPEMREKLGDVGTLAWLQYLDLMARKGGAEGAKRIAALDILRKNIGAGVLSFRLSSALVQFSSFADTVATMGVEWATKGATAITNKEWRNFIMDNFPEIKKAVGDDIAFREFGEGSLAKLANTGLKPLQFLDGLMRSTAAAAAYQKLAAVKGITIDLTNPNANLIAEATKLMRNSQGSSFFKDQPLAITAGYGLTDNRSVNKLLLTFQSFMLNRWDNINRQIYRLGIKEKNYGKAISSIFWLLVFAGSVEEGIRRGTRKITQSFSKDKRKEDSFIQDSLLNMVQSVPVLGQLVSSITYSSNPVPVINTFDDLLEGVGAMAKGKAVETKIKGAVKTLGSAGSLSGIAGSSQLSQIIKSMIPQGKKSKKGKQF